jgi:signal transduction histidine kinase
LDVVSTDRAVAAAALTRAVLIGRAVATIIAGAAGLLLVTDRWRIAEVLGLVAAGTAAQVGLLARRPRLATRPFPALAADSILVLGVLALGRGDIAYFVFAAGAGALAGVLLGLWAVPVWAGQAAVSFAVIGTVLHRLDPPAELAAFVVGFPVAGALAGLGTSMLTSALTRYLELSRSLVASAQRSAAASERARLARELHDSVSKTLRGVSLAALALPTSLRRQPALAEQLAGTVAEGATAAARQARELLEEMRLDVPDRDFATTVRELCDAWSAATGVAVRTVLDPIDPPITVGYELSRIVREALANIANHAYAQRVLVEISDDGMGFAVPRDLSRLQTAGHFGIVGMTERATNVGGDLHVDSAPGAGTTITVRVPLGVFAVDGAL